MGIYRKARTFLSLVRENLLANRTSATPQIQQILSQMQKAQLLQTPRYADEKRLERFGFKVYSQNDEDGIIEEIFARIGEKSRFFVEFGVQDGLECNSHYLLFRGWEGVFIEGSADFCAQIRRNFAPAIAQNRLTLLHNFITTENINDLLNSTKAAALREIDLLSIDIDGNDFWVWRAINAINPRVIAIEFNAKFPPPAQYIMPYNAAHIWDGSDIQGASLESLAKLGAQKGYQLVATNFSGVNAFFVRRDLCADKFPQDASAKNLYNPWRAWREVNGHPAMKFLENGAK